MEINKKISDKNFRRMLDEVLEMDFDAYTRATSSSRGRLSEKIKSACSESDARAIEDLVTDFIAVDELLCFEYGFGLGAAMVTSGSLKIEV